MIRVETSLYLKRDMVLRFVEENKYVCHPAMREKVQCAVDKINRAEQRQKVFALRPQG